MYKSESRANPILINSVIKVYEFDEEPLEPIGILASSKSNFEVDSIPHYRESITLQYPI